MTIADEERKAKSRERMRRYRETPAGKMNSQQARQKWRQKDKTRAWYKTENRRKAAASYSAARLLKSEEARKKHNDCVKNWATSEEGRQKRKEAEKRRILKKKINEEHNAFMARLELDDQRVSHEIQVDT